MASVCISELKFMRKRYYIFAICLLFNITGYCQEIKLIKIDSLYSECGVLFPASYDLSIELENLKTRVTPSLEEVTVAEQILLKHFKTLDHSKSNFPDGSRVSDARNYFDKFIRQYIGYEDQRGNRNVLIHLLNNTMPRKVRKTIGTNWKEKFIVILAQPMPFQILTYRVNLTTKTLHTDF
jgi:hypothetical protein